MNKMNKTQFFNILSTALTVIAIVAFLLYAIIGIDDFIGRIFLIVGCITIFSASISAGIYDIFLTKEIKELEAKEDEENHENN